MKLWGNYADKRIIEFTTGNDYVIDRKLVKYDCMASIAHAKMLNKTGFLKKKEASNLISGLREIINLDKKNKFKIKKQDEDCHTAIENYLTRKLGDAGKKIHFARSRNDQVLTALRLYEKDELFGCKEEISKLIKSISGFSKKYSKIKFPGYTHTRKAMPSSVKLWADSFVESLKDDLKLINAGFELVNQSPLGTGAGYGFPAKLKVDRNYTAKEIGFKRIQHNQIYVQNSRGKFESTILHSLSNVMLDLNKIASDIILFSMPELNYFELPREICTGSSIMPHKRNPDVLEIIRANYHVVSSCESRVKGIIRNLISGYNRDLQLTKEPIMNGFDVTKESISAMSLVFEKLKANKEKCENALTSEIYSAEKAYNLSGKIPFRDMYRKVSREY